MGSLRATRLGVSVPGLHTASAELIRNVFVKDDYAWLHEDENFQKIFIEDVSEQGLAPVLWYRIQEKDQAADWPQPVVTVLHELSMQEAGAELLREAELKKIQDLHLGRIDDGDFYAKSLYLSGKIFERQGQTERAIQHYKRFLDLWNDADPDLPERSDARTRLSRLE